MSHLFYASVFQARGCLGVSSVLQILVPPNHTCHAVRCANQTFAFSLSAHAYRDLKAYICTVGGKGCDSEFFGDRDSWFEHELKKHRARYRCTLCPSSQAVFTPVDLRTHILDYHGTFDDNQLEMLAEGGREVITHFRAKDCPFCDEWHRILSQKMPESDRAALVSEGRDIMVSANRFKKHLAVHQQQLAIFAMPRAAETDGSGGSGSVFGTSSDRSMPSESVASDKVSDTDRKVRRDLLSLELLKTHLRHSLWEISSGRLRQENFTLSGGRYHRKHELGEGDGGMEELIHTALQDLSAKGTESRFFKLYESEAGGDIWSQSLSSFERSARLKEFLTAAGVDSHTPGNDYDVEPGSTDGQDIARRGFEDSAVQSPSNHENATLKSSMITATQSDLWSDKVRLFEDLVTGAQTLVNGSDRTILVWPVSTHGECESRSGNLDAVPPGMSKILGLGRWRFKFTPSSTSGYGIGQVDYWVTRHMPDPEDSTEHVRAGRRQINTLRNIITAISRPLTGEVPAGSEDGSESFASSTDTRFKAQTDENTKPHDETGSVTGKPAARNSINQLDKDSIWIERAEAVYRYAKENGYIDHAEKLQGALDQGTSYGVSDALKRLVREFENIQRLEVSGSGHQAMNVDPDGSQAEKAGPHIRQPGPANSSPLVKETTVVADHFPTIPTERLEELLQLSVSKGNEPAESNFRTTLQFRRNHGTERSPERSSTDGEEYAKALERMLNAWPVAFLESPEASSLEGDKDLQFQSTSAGATEGNADPHSVLTNESVKGAKADLPNLQVFVGPEGSGKEKFTESAEASLKEDMPHIVQAADTGGNASPRSQSHTPHPREDQEKDQISPADTQAWRQRATSPPGMDRTQDAREAAGDAQQFTAGFEAPSQDLQKWRNLTASTPAPSFERDELGHYKNFSGIPTRKLGDLFLLASEKQNIVIRNAIRTATHFRQGQPGGYPHEESTERGEMAAAAIERMVLSGQFWPSMLALTSLGRRRGISGLKEEVLPSAGENIEKRVRKAQESQQSQCGCLLINGYMYQPNVCGGCAGSHRV